MNQHIRINYKPDWSSYSNYWEIWFELNYRYHREKIPSWLNSDEYWSWYIRGKLKKRGKDLIKKTYKTTW